MSLSENHTSGYFLVSRSIFKSEVWYLDSDYAKVLIILIGEAAHSDQQRKWGYSLQRGQCFLTYADLAEQIGYRRRRGAISRVKRIMTYLRKSGTISTKKKPRGVLVTLLHYEKYQNPANYNRAKERTSKSSEAEPRANQDRPSINNNEKNGKNENNDKDVRLRNEILKHLADPISDIDTPEGYLKKIERSCSPEAIRRAWRDWKGGHGIEHPSQFFARCREYQNQIDKAQKGSVHPTTHDADAP